MISKFNTLLKQTIKFCSPIRQISGFIKMKYLNQQEAIKVDEDLMGEFGYSIYQLMELAGLSVAQAISKSYPIIDGLHSRPIVCCGPGNNGGDGLVAARHLKLFGYSPVIIYPRKPKQELYDQLLKQCEAFDIPIHTTVPREPLNDMGNILVDCVFGFSFKPPNRNEQFANLLKKIHDCHQRCKEIPLVSVDIPSGWDVEKGWVDIEKDQAGLEESYKISILKPDCLISLTAPKLCAKTLSKDAIHYLGGRFCPQKLVDRYNLSLPSYPNSDGFILLELSD